MNEQMKNEAQFAALVWGGFYRCPTTGRILEALKGDDKVMCGCGVSNPLVPQECTKQTGTHLIRHLKAATAEQYVAQQHATEADS